MGLPNMYKESEAVWISVSVMVMVVMVFDISIIHWFHFDSVSGTVMVLYNTNTYILVFVLFQFVKFILYYFIEIVKTVVIVN